MVTKILRKAFYKILGLNPYLDRFVRYRNPRQYWQKRGGDIYFQEQEVLHNRTLRSQFIGNEVNKLQYNSLLEIGCGYGKQLRNFHSKGVFLVGCDFSRPQLLKARESFGDNAPGFIEADAEILPFADKSFDVVLSSAVILHNEFEKAKKIIAEVIRVSRKYIVHNEDTDVTFSRYGYDMRKTYEKMNFKLVKSVQIPTAPDPAITQFTVVALEPTARKLSPSEIKLEYHR